MKKYKEPLDIEVLCTIYCSKCNFLKTSAISEDEANEYFSNLGWVKTIYGNQYCSQCSIKRLKT